MQDKTQTKFVRDLAKRISKYWEPEWVVICEDEFGNTVEKVYARNCALESLKANMQEYDFPKEVKSFHIMVR